MSDAHGRCTFPCAHTIISWLLPAFKGFTIRIRSSLRFRVIQTRKTLCALRVYTQAVISVLFVHRHGNTHACLTQGWNLFLLLWTSSLNDRSKLKGQCSDVKIGCGTSEGPSLNAHSPSLKTLLVLLSLLLLHLGKAYCQAKEFSPPRGWLRTADHI